MRIRLANRFEIFAIRNTATFKICREEANRPSEPASWLNKLRPRGRRFRFVAELEGNARGYLIGALTHAHGMVEDFLICTNEGINEISHALFEIFEVHCLRYQCRSIFAPVWMDEMLIKARGFDRLGSLYVKRFEHGAVVDD
jgi:hypothetical protein